MDKEKIIKLLRFLVLAMDDKEKFSYKESILQIASEYGERYEITEADYDYILNKTIAELIAQFK